MSKKLSSPDDLSGLKENQPSMSKSPSLASSTSSRSSVHSIPDASPPLPDDPNFSSPLPTRLVDPPSPEKEKPSYGNLKTRTTKPRGKFFDSSSELQPSNNRSLQTPLFKPT